MATCVQYWKAANTHEELDRPEGWGGLGAEAWTPGGPGLVPSRLHSWRRTAYRAGGAPNGAGQLHRRGARGAVGSGSEGARRRCLRPATASRAGNSLAPNREPSIESTVGRTKEPTSPFSPPAAEVRRPYGHEVARHPEAARALTEAGQDVPSRRSRCRLRVPSSALALTRCPHCPALPPIPETR